MQVLTYSAQEVIAAMKAFVGEYTLGDREDVFLMLAAIERDSPRTSEPSDPAAWTDWVKCLWGTRGYELSQPRIDPTVYVTFPSGRVSRAVVSIAENTIFDDVPASELVDGGRTELEGFDLFRNEVEKAYRVENVNDMAAISLRVASI